MANDENRIDVEGVAKEIAAELLHKFSDSGITAAKEIARDDCRPSGARFVCDEKECEKDFTCHPAKEFECTSHFKG